MKQKTRSLLVSSIVAILLLLPIASMTVGSPTNAYAAGVTGTDLKFSVEPMSSKLPADKGTYFVIIQLQTAKDGIPIEAPYDLDIQLFSSDPSVAYFLSDKVTLEQGKSYARADIQTTSKPSEVELTAQADGVTADVGILNTVELDTLDPSRIDIFAAPSKMMPNPKYPAKLYVQLLNSQNLPAPAKERLVIALSSGDTNIGTVPNFIVIPAGSSGGFVDFTPGYEIGSTKVTASLRGLMPGHIDITTAGLTATKLAVEVGVKITPGSKISSNGLSIVSIQLRDDQDFPVNAYQNTRIYLKSSNEDVAKISDYIDIPAGSSYGIARLSGAGGYGSAQITASASGFKTGFATVQTFEENVNGQPEKLHVFTAPSILPPDDSTHQAIYIQATDENGSPVDPSGHRFYDMIVTSSNTRAGDVGNAVDRSYYWTVDFTTGLRSGETVITVAKDGFLTSQAKLEVKGPAATALSISQIQSIVQADGSTHTSLAVAIVDSKGNPVAAEEELYVYLSTSSPEIISEAHPVTIAAGKYYAIADVKTTTKPGESVITASAQGLTSASVAFKTIGFTKPYTLGLFSVPTTFSSDGTLYESIVVQFQDISGNPAVAPIDIPVSVSTSSLSAGLLESDSVTIKAGSTYAIANFNITDKINSGTRSNIETFTMTASSQGYDGITSSMRVAAQPLTIKTLRHTDTPGYISFPVDVDVLSGNLAVRDALVQISGQNAEVRTGTTDENGHAQVTYVPTKPGANTVIVTVSKPGYATATQTSSVTLVQTIDLAVNAATQGGRDIMALMEVVPPSGNAIKKDVQAGIPLTFDNTQFGLYTISTPPEITTADAAYKFVGWSDGVTDNPRVTNVVEDSKITALYSAKYLLTVSSKFGTVTGAGWYDEGTMVDLSISPTSETGILVDRSFAGWSGDLKSQSSDLKVSMSGPMNITAEWTDSYLKLILLLAAGGGVGGYYFYKKKLQPYLATRAVMQKQEDDRAPELDWFKP